MLAGAGAESALDSAPALRHDLLERASRQDAAAWNELLTYFSPKFQVLAGRLLSRYGRSYGITADRQRIEDLVQMTWMHIASSRERLARDFTPEKGSLAGFIMTVANNHMLDQLRIACRAWQHEVGMELQPELADARPNPEQRATQDNELAAIQAHMQAALSADDRELIERVLLKEENVTTIAEELGLPRNTVDKRYSRALQKLREVLRKCRVAS